MTREPKQGVEYLPGQAEMPGCEPSESNRARQLVMAPLRSAKSQMACDIGLFAQRGQIDIEDLT